MANEERTLVENIKHAKGKYGGFCFGGQFPDGASAYKPLPKGTVFPNGAKAAVLLTFGVVGTYGNGVGDLNVEIANYKRITEAIAKKGITATFAVVGQMADEKGPDFVRWMLDAGCEVATHGYIHDLNKRYGGDLVYHGHYGFEENYRNIKEGIDALNKIQPGIVHGMRVPYAHFNEFTFEAMQKLGLKWSSLVGHDDFVVPGQGFGFEPFQMKLGDTVYPFVQIPVDSQTYDWPIWVGDEAANKMFVECVRKYCDSRNIAFDRTPKGGAVIWKSRIQDTIDNQRVFALLSHPINMAIPSDKWKDAVADFLFPVIDHLAEMQKQKKVWVPTCSQMADVYIEKMM